MRCEEIFRQICWLEERFWPDVDGMGEEDESARLGASGLGPMSAGVGGMENTMSNALNNAINNQNLNNQNLNGQGMNAPGMNGPMSSTGINGPMNGPMNGPGMNNGDGTPVGDRNNFGLEGVGQNA